MKKILESNQAEIRSENVLDVGPTINMPLTSVFVTSETAVCIDISAAAIKKTKESTPEYECILANCEGLPFKDERFDFLYAGQVIEHLHHPQEFLQEAYRVLQPNGFLLIDTPNSNVTRIMDVLMQIFFRRKLGPSDHVRVFSHAEMRKALTAQGFKIFGTYGLYLPLTLFLPIPYLIHIAMTLGYKVPRASFLIYFLAQK